LSFSPTAYLLLNLAGNESPPAEVLKSPILASAKGTAIQTMSSRQNSSRATGGHAPVTSTQSSTERGSAAPSDDVPILDPQFDVPAGLNTFLALTAWRTGKFTPDQTRLLNRIVNLINHESRTNESIGSVLPTATKDDANLLHAMSLIQRDAMLAANGLSLFESLLQRRFASLAPALDFANAANL
ncbi:hypothetical protein KCU82_g965, partial [Aureobasidium melanogenum]